MSVSPWLYLLLCVMQVAVLWQIPKRCNLTSFFTIVNILGFGFLAAATGMRYAREIHDEELVGEMFPIGTAGTTLWTDLIRPPLAPLGPELTEGPPHVTHTEQTQTEELIDVTVDSYDLGVEMGIAISTTTPDGQFQRRAWRIEPDMATSFAEELWDTATRVRQARRSPMEIPK